MDSRWGLKYGTLHVWILEYRNKHLQQQPLDWIDWNCRLYLDDEKQISYFDENNLRNLFFRSSMAELKRQK